MPTALLPIPTPASAPPRPPRPRTTHARSDHPATPRPPVDDAALQRMTSAFATLFVEVEAGLRPRRQLRRLMCPKLYAQLADVWVRPHLPHARVSQVRGSRPAAHRYEAVATLWRDERAGALALSLRRSRSGWRVEMLARPEEGPPPALAFDWPDDLEDHLATW